MPIKKYFTEEERKQAKLDSQTNYRNKNKEKIKQSRNKYLSNNKHKTREYAKTYYENNKSKIIEKKKEYYLENKDRCLEYRKNYKWDKIHLVNQYSRAYKNKNKTKVSEYNKNYHKANPEKFVMAKVKRRDRKLILDESGHINKCLYITIRKKFNNECFNCKSDKELSIDHHYPLYLGNPLTINNAVLLCRSCNCKKNKKLPESFYSPEQLTDLQDNYGITKQPLKIVEQPSLFPSWTTGNLERENDKVQAMNAA